MKEKGKINECKDMFPIVLGQAEKHHPVYTWLTYPQVVQTDADIVAHLQEGRNAGLVEEDVDWHISAGACLLKIFEDIQVCE